MGVKDRQPADGVPLPIGERDRPVPQKGPEDGVDQPVRSPRRAPLGQIDGLEDGRVIRNAVEKLDLVEGHPQDVPNDRRERLGVPPGLLADRGVEPHPVPHDAVDKLEGEAPVGLPEGIDPRPVDRRFDGEILPPDPP